MEELLQQQVQAGSQALVWLCRQSLTKFTTQQRMTLNPDVPALECRSYKHPPSDPEYGIKEGKIKAFEQDVKL